MPQKNKSKANWTRRILWCLLFLTAAAAGTYFFAKNQVRDRVDNQLAQLGLGPHEIGEVSIGQNGIRASNVQFFKNAKDQRSDSPWLSVENFDINHSLSGLIAGDDFYSELVLSGLRVEVDLDVPSSNAPIDLSTIDIPAAVVRLSDSDILIKQGQRSVLIEDIDLELSNGENPKVAGVIGDLLGNAWDVTGVLNANANQWKLNLKSNNAELSNDQWQQLPGIPANLSDYVQVDARSSLNVQLAGSGSQDFQYTVDSKINEAEIRLPQFDLPVKVSQADISLKDGKLKYDNVVATTDGTDRLNATGRGTLDNLFHTTFEFAFENTALTTARKFVPTIPEIASGRFSGKSNGQLAVESDLRTTLKLGGQANAPAAIYGDVNAENLRVNFTVQPIVFDESLNIVDLQGDLILVADAKQQSVANILDTLDLTSLKRQLDIDAKGTGKFHLSIPLDRAESLDAWTAKVSAQVADALISGQKIKAVELTVEMKSGQLYLVTKNATPVATMGRSDQPSAEVDSNANLDIAVQWPISNAAAEQFMGTVKVTGESIPPKWLTYFLAAQIDNANEPGPAATDAIGESRLANLQGTTDFVAELKMNPVSPEKIESWQASATVQDSTLHLDQVQVDLQKLNIGIDNGQLTVDSVTAKLQTGGEVSGRAAVSLLTGEVDSASITGKSVPANWLADLLGGESPEANGVLDKIGGQQAIDGNLDITVVMPQADTNASVDAYSLSVSSDELSVQDQKLKDVQVDGIWTSTKLDIQRASATVGEQGQLVLNGDWDWNRAAGSAVLKWQQIPLRRLAHLAGQTSSAISGSTSGNLRLWPTKSDDGTVLPGDLKGQVIATGFRLGQFKSEQFSFRVQSEQDTLRLDQLRFAEKLNGVSVSAVLDLKEPFDFQSNGTIASVPLSRVFSESTVFDRKNRITSVTGIVDSTFKIQGKLMPFDWGSNGHFDVTQLTLDNQSVDDISADWSHIGNDWKKTSATINAFGGKVKLAKLLRAPQRIKVEIVDLDAAAVSALLPTPIGMSGKLSGDASLNDWDLSETRWADLNLRGASIKAGLAQLGDLDGKINFRKQTANYSLAGRFIGGKFASSGTTTINLKKLDETKFPLTVEFENGRIGEVYKKSSSFLTLRPLRGKIAAKVNLVLNLNEPPSGSGNVQVQDLKWNNELLTREISATAKLSAVGVVVDELRADLRRGELSGKAFLPYGPTSGSYQLRFRQFDLQRFLKVVVNDSIKGAGLLDARISGNIGQKITGQGSVSINRASLLGLAGETFQVPIRFNYVPLQSSGIAQIRDSRFRMFHGNVSGSASLAFGRRLDLDTDLTFSKIDTSDLLKSFAGIQDAGQGDLSGTLKLKGSSIRSLRDLDGSFKGTLDRTNVFELPLLNQIGRFLGGNQIQSQAFESDDIDILLNKGKANIRRLNFSNSLAKISITGNAYTDGRLDLGVAARVERLNQPTLLDQFAGSPLARLQGSPVAIFAQAADFLSERLVFLKVGGTIQRPQVRPDGGKQLREEAIRYFLRGSQILPIEDLRNN